MVSSSFHLLFLLLRIPVKDPLLVLSKTLTLLVVLPRAGRVPGGTIVLPFKNNNK